MNRRVVLNGIAIGLYFGSFWDKRRTFVLLSFSTRYRTFADSVESFQDVFGKDLSKQVTSANGMVVVKSSRVDRI